MRTGKILGNALLVLLLTGCLLQGGKEVRSYVGAEKEMNLLREQAEKYPGSGVKAERREQAEPEIDFQLLKTVNPDIRGWLRIPDTPIDYPVLIGTEEGDYLKRNFRGEEDPLGSVFSYVGTDLGGDAHIYLFAHNLISGQMFGGLKKFLDPAFAETHVRAFLYTPGGCRKFRFLSAVSCRMDQVFQQKEAESGKALSLITCGGGEGTIWRTVVTFSEEKAPEAAEAPAAPG